MPCLRLKSKAHKSSCFTKAQLTLRIKPLFLVNQSTPSPSLLKATSSLVELLAAAFVPSLALCPPVEHSGIDALERVQEMGCGGLGCGGCSCSPMVLKSPSCNRSGDQRSSLKQA